MRSVWATANCSRPRRSSAVVQALWASAHGRPRSSPCPRAGPQRVTIHTPGRASTAPTLGSRQGGSLCGYGRSETPKTADTTRERAGLPDDRRRPSATSSVGARGRRRPRPRRAALARRTAAGSLRVCVSACDTRTSTIARTVRRTNQDVDHRPDPVANGEENQCAPGRRGGRREQRERSRAPLPAATARGAGEKNGSCESASLRVCV